MAAIVVPFRGVDGKQRLGPLPDEIRHELALAMLGDVVFACSRVGETRVVTSDPAAAELAGELAAEVVADPGGGQGAAVAAGLRAVDGRAVVVNADVPCVVPEDVRALRDATPDPGIAYVAAADGTTNALGLSSPGLFQPFYGPGSAERFRLHAQAQGVAAMPAVIPNLRDDVDSLSDLDRLQLRLGPRTLAAFPA